MVMKDFIVFVNDFHEWERLVVVMKEVTKVVVGLHFCSLLNYEAFIIKQAFINELSFW